MPGVEALRRDPRVLIVEAHQCAFGITAHLRGRGNETGPVKKPTGF